MSNPGSPRPAAATILLIGADLAAALNLTSALESRGHQVYRVTTGRAARAVLGEVRPDVVVLDLDIPDVDGLVLCADLKERSGAPIIICGEPGRRREVILGLRLGADDFIPKPFAVDDLVVARVQAALRHARQPGAQARAGAAPGTASTASTASAPVARIQPMRVGSLVVDDARRLAAVGHVALELTPTEYRILHALAGRPDEVLSRGDLATEIWSQDDPGIRHSLDVHTRRLRAKLRAANSSAPEIVTVRGVGYRLNPQPTASSGGRGAEPADTWGPTEVGRVKV